MLLARTATGPNQDPNQKFESIATPEEGLRLPDPLIDKARPRPQERDTVLRPHGFPLSWRARIPGALRSRTGHDGKTLHLSDGYYVDPAPGDRRRAHRAIPPATVTPIKPYARRLGS